MNLVGFHRRDLETAEATFPPDLPKPRLEGNRGGRTFTGDLAGRVLAVSAIIRGHQQGLLIDPKSSQA